MKTSTPARSAPSSFGLWAVACFFLSGAAGLIYEVVWSKQLAYLLGSSLHATSAVVAAFLAGLALGAKLLGTPLSRRWNRPRTYAALEALVAVAGVGLLPLLRHLDPVVGPLYRALGGETPLFAFVRLLLLFVLLVPPAALMGATLPVLVAHFQREAVGRALGRLYALNTFGAVAGSIAAGFWLLPNLGMGGATLVAALLNVVAAGLALGFGSREAAPAAPGERASAPASADPRVPSVAPASRAVFAAMFAASGFAALALQIAWVRLFGLVLGSSVYSFSAVLGIYLLGIAAGSALIAPWLGRRTGLAMFAILQLLLALASVAGVHLFARLPQQMFDLQRTAGPHWESLFSGELLLVAQVILLPCVLLGAVFPLAAQLLHRGDRGDSTGFAYAVNTLGTIAGSLAAGFWLLPALGVQGTTLAAAGISACAGLGAMALARVRGELRWPAALAAGIAALAALAAWSQAPAWDAPLMSTGAYRPFNANSLARAFAGEGRSGDDVVAQVAGTYRRLYYRDGINATVLVASDPADTRRWLTVNGKVDASTGDMKTQVLLGLVPGALADSGARALVIGLGSGITAASALAAGAGPTDIVELEPGVIAGSRFFHAKGADPLDDPRVTVHMADARTMLAHSRQRYGLVISEPSNPWIAGVNNLFTVDFYRLVRARLTDDGVFCQWIQMYELRPETFASLVKSFRAVFPQAQVFCVWRSHDLLLIATPPSRRLDPSRAQSPAARALLTRAKFASPEQLAAFYLGPIDSLRALALDVALDTDDRPIVEYRAPRDLVEIGLSGFLADTHMSPEILDPAAPPARSPFADWPAAVWAEWRASEMLGLATAEQVPAVLARLRASGLGTLAEHLGSELAAARTRNDRTPEDVAPVILRGQSELAAGHAAAALELFRQAQRLAPRDPRGYDYEARAHASGRDFRAASEAIDRGLAAVPGDPSLLLARQAMGRMLALQREHAR